MNCMFLQLAHRRRRWLAVLAPVFCFLAQPTPGLAQRSAEVPFPTSLKAAERGDAAAMYKVFVAYRDGLGVAADESQATNWLAKAAKAGSADAQCLMGVLNDNLYGRYQQYLRANFPEAVRWYSLAAEQGHPRAQYHLGLCYLEGKGVDQSEERALELVREAAAQEDPESLCQLADFYARGIGEPQNEQDRPLQLLQRAAAKGWDKAYEGIIFKFQFGVGTPGDLVAAAEWYCRAALAQIEGYSIGDKLELRTAKQLPLASEVGAPDRTSISLVMPYKGDRETQQLLAVISLYLKGARHEPNSLFELGRMFVKGNGAPRDLSQAWRWLTLAARHGSSDAPGLLSEIGPRMNKSELDEAKKLLAGLEEELRNVAAALHTSAHEGDR